MPGRLPSGRKAQRKLRETNNFYEQILNQLPMELGVFDTEAQFEYVNAQGVSDPELFGEQHDPPLSCLLDSLAKEISPAPLSKWSIPS